MVKQDIYGDASLENWPQAPCSPSCHSSGVVRQPLQQQSPNTLDAPIRVHDSPQCVGERPSQSVHAQVQEIPACFQSLVGHEEGATKQAGVVKLLAAELDRRQKEQQLKNSVAASPAASQVATSSLVATGMLELRHSMPVLPASSYKTTPAANPSATVRRKQARSKNSTSSSQGKVLELAFKFDVQAKEGQGSPPASPLTSLIHGLDQSALNHRTMFSGRRRQRRHSISGQPFSQSTPRLANFSLHTSQSLGSTSQVFAAPAAAASGAGPAKSSPASAPNQLSPSGSTPYATPMGTGVSRGGSRWAGGSVQGSTLHDGCMYATPACGFATPAIGSGSSRHATPASADPAGAAVTPTSSARSDLYIMSPNSKPRLILPKEGVTGAEVVAFGAHFMRSPEGSNWSQGSPFMVHPPEGDTPAPAPASDSPFLFTTHQDRASSPAHQAMSRHRSSSDADADAAAQGGTDSACLSDCQTTHLQGPLPQPTPEASSEVETTQSSATNAPASSSGSPAHQTSAESSPACVAMWLVSPGSPTPGGATSPAASAAADPSAGPTTDLTAHPTPITMADPAADFTADSAADQADQEPSPAQSPVSLFMSEPNSPPAMASQNEPASPTRQAPSSCPLRQQDELAGSDAAEVTQPTQAGAVQDTSCSPPRSPAASAPRNQGPDHMAVWDFLRAPHPVPASPFSAGAACTPAVHAVDITTPISRPSTFGSGTPETVSPSLPLPPAFSADLDPTPPLPALMLPPPHPPSPQSRAHGQEGPCSPPTAARGREAASNGATGIPAAAFGSPFPLEWAQGGLARLPANHVSTEGTEPGAEQVQSGAKTSPRFAELAAALSPEPVALNLFHSRLSESFEGWATQREPGPPPATRGRVADNPQQLQQSPQDAGPNNRQRAAAAPQGGAPPTPSRGLHTSLPLPDPHHLASNLWRVWGLQEAPPPLPASPYDAIAALTPTHTAMPGTPYTPLTQSSSARSETPGTASPSLPLPPSAAPSRAGTLALTPLPRSLPAMPLPATSTMARGSESAAPPTWEAAPTQTPLPRPPAAASEAMYTQDDMEALIGAGDLYTLQCMALQGALSSAAVKATVRRHLHAPKVVASLAAAVAVRDLDHLLALAELVGAPASIAVLEAAARQVALAVTSSTLVHAAPIIQAQAEKKLLVHSAAVTPCAAPTTHQSGAQALAAACDALDAHCFQALGAAAACVQAADAEYLAACAFESGIPGAAYTVQHALASVCWSAAALLGAVSTANADATPRSPSTALASPDGMCTPASATAARSPPQTPPSLSPTQGFGSPVADTSAGAAAASRLTLATPSSVHSLATPLSQCTPLSVRSPASARSPSIAGVSPIPASPTSPAVRQVLAGPPEALAALSPDTKQVALPLAVHERNLRALRYMLPSDPAGAEYTLGLGVEWDDGQLVAAAVRYGRPPQHLLDEALAAAAQTQASSAVFALLQGGANPAAWGWEALHSAAAALDAPSLAAILVGALGGRGVPSAQLCAALVQAVGQQCVTSQAEAVYVVNLLLSAGADPAAPGVLPAAAAGGNAEVVQLLLLQGACGAHPELSQALEAAAALGHTAVREVLQGVDVMEGMEVMEV